MISKQKKGVEEPHDVNCGLFLLAQVTTYTIVIEEGATHFGIRRSIRKRYSEFETLQKHLEQRYEGMLIPSLPPKRVVGNNNQVFVKSRMRGLQIFVSALGCNPFLMSDSIVREFLTPDGDVPPSEEQNVGFQNWTAFLQNFPMPESPEVQFTKV